VIQQNVGAHSVNDVTVHSVYLMRTETEQAIHERLNGIGMLMVLNSYRVKTFGVFQIFENSQFGTFTIQFQKAKVPIGWDMRIKPRHLDRYSLPLSNHRCDSLGAPHLNRISATIHKGRTNQLGLSFKVCNGETPGLHAASETIDCNVFSRT